MRIMTGTNHTSRKVLIKNNSSIVGLFLINGGFWRYHRFFVTLGIIGDLRLKLRYLQTMILQYQERVNKKSFHKIS